MPGWTAEDVPRQDGRLALVTGATSGIGLRTAIGLARAGARLVLAARDAGRGAAALARVRAAAPGAEAEVERLDLADLGSVRAAAAAVTARHGRLDVLVDNAGVMAIPRRETVDGFEMQLGTNHLGHFALTGLLLEALLASPDPRVVTVSSGAHRMGRIRWDDLQGERRYRRWEAYGQSKLANLLFAFELQRRADRAGAALRSTAAHPGLAATNLQLVGPRMDGSRALEHVMRLVNRVLAQDDAHGALPVLYAATMDLPGGTYVGPDGPGEMRGAPTIVGARDAAYDEEDARRLWEASERLTGVRYDRLAAPTAA